MENVSIYRLKCLTNMHVGDGEVNYNIIDNEVQKDIVLGVPTIHSSGVKGALRSYVHNKKNDDIDEDYIFGAQGKETSQGAYKFFSANMIARPLRVSDGTEAYVLATSVDIINTQLNLLKSLRILCWIWSFLPTQSQTKSLHILAEHIADKIPSRHYDLQFSKTTLNKVVTSIIHSCSITITNVYRHSFNQCNQKVSITHSYSITLIAKIILSFFHSTYQLLIVILYHRLVCILFAPKIMRFVSITHSYSITWIYVENLSSNRNTICINYS